MSADVVDGIVPADPRFDGGVQRDSIGQPIAVDMCVERVEPTAAPPLAVGCLTRARSSCVEDGVSETELSAVSVEVDGEC